LTSQRLKKQCKMQNVFTLNFAFLILNCFNAIWQLFSAVPEHVRYGASHYRWKTEISTVMNDLFRKYNTEGVIMPYTVEDYKRDYARRYLHSLTPEEVLESFSAEEKLRTIPIQDVVKYLTQINNEALREIMKKMSSES